MVLKTGATLILATFSLITNPIISLQSSSSTSLSSSSSSSSSTSEMLFIRHGRSRVRHSNEKDHIRWGLKAFDNLTLDYELTDNYDNDTMILYGGELWSLDNISFVNQTSNTINNNGLINYNQVTTQTPLVPTIIPIRKKFEKKKIMENIRKDVYKGLEYLKQHHRTFNDNKKLIKISINSEETGYQNDAGNILSLNSNENSKKDRSSETISISKISTTSTTSNEPFTSEPITTDITKTLLTIVDDQTLEVNQPYNNLPHSVPARLSVPYKQQLAAREGELINSNNEKSSATNRNGVEPIPERKFDDGNYRNNEIETSSAIPNGRYIGDDDEEELDDDGPNQSASTSNKIANGGGDSGIDSFDSSNNIDLDASLSDEPDDIDADIVDENGNRFNVFSTSDDSDLSDLDEISRNNRLNLMKGRDVVTKFLQIVETQHLLGANCTAGTALNLGEGVVDQYAQDRFRIEAEVAVNRANMLTRIFKLTSPSVQASEHLLHASVLSMVEFDDDIFAAGNCFDWNQHPSKAGLFCPFAYRLPPPDQGASFAKDLAAEYHYLGNTSEWFFLARKNAEKVIARNDQYIKAYHMYSNSTKREADEILSVKYEDGRWSKPYYDCGGGNIWMLTYTVPFFGHENETYFFKGTSGIDIDLRRVDIDQCPQRNTPGTTQPLNIFAGTDKCKQRTTMCEAITGLGFRRGSYKCVCRKGFYYPETTAPQKYFNGSILEEEYEKLMLGEESTYSKPLTYECLPCAEGCDYCEDASPCVAALNWPMRTSILVLACAVIGLLPPAAWFTFRYQQVKVVRAASPALLRVIALGAFFIYCTTIVMYPPPSLYTCTARIWLREIGFSLTYGALMLKTWRISVIFRVRSAKAVKITDAALLKRLGVICGAIGACLLVRTVVSPPEVVVGRTADDLKAFLCKTDWWDYTFTSMEVLFLAWGVRLCIMVRKAPSEFNESRFISMAIYNEFLLTCFLNVSMLFLQSPANPDLLYIIFFCHTQLTVTLLLGLIFGSKVYIVLRSGKSQENAIGLGAKSSGAKFNFRPQIRTFANPSTATSSTAQIAGNADTKLSDQEALEEIRQLSVQLQRIQELAPPRGIAVMTISSLLDGLKTTTHQLSLRPPSQSTSYNLPVHPINCESQTTTILSSCVKAEKSINTQLSGDEFWRQLQLEYQLKLEKNFSEHCEHHLTSPIPSISSQKCNHNRTRSPKDHHESCDLSFSELQLECMCAAPSDYDNEHHYSYDQIDNYCIKSINNHKKLCNREHKHDHNCIKSINSDLIIDDRQCSTSVKHKLNQKHAKFHSSCNLINQSKDINSSNSCDNHKSNDHFLICDNCKNKFVNNKGIELNLDSRRLVVDYKTKSNDDISFHSTDNDDDNEHQHCYDHRVHYHQDSSSDNHQFMTSNNNSNSSTGNKKGRNRKSEKLVLDLNDRSKYTKEVSV